jgi:hypothetical protein
MTILCKINLFIFSSAMIHKDKDFITEDEFVIFVLNQKEVLKLVVPLISVNKESEENLN